ncbi:hypothetical protein [Pseudomonas sp. efr-133-TYG-103a]|uniref:hypothetical protein n=1 Tax=Pseudomonas sp. efr-133-TYG-103a TaxID=3040308 RepID=UPI00255496A8|nr:hypothetical protein [Pseudomonas sp. efr-133-TYG-103a]
MLESRAVTLLVTFVDELAYTVAPLDFTALLYLRDQGYVDVSIQGGRVVARRTPQGNRFVSERTSVRAARPNS